MRTVERLKELVTRVQDPTQSIVEIRCIYDNLGDIMVANAISELLSPMSLFDGDVNWKVRLFDGLVGIRRAFRSVVLGGGTLIFAPRGIGWLELLDFYIQRIAPLCTFGTGVIDPAFRTHMTRLDSEKFVVSNATIEKWIAVLRRFPFVSVRGVESQRLLLENGLDAVEVIGDPALFYSRPSISPKLRAKKVGINLSRTSDFWSNSANATMNAMLHIAQHLVAEGWQVTLFSTQADDDALLAHIPSALLERVSVCKCWRDPTRFISEVERQDVFLGVKLHSVICAFCSYTPSIMIGYQPKCLDFMKTMGFEQFHIRSDQISTEQVIALIDKMYDDIEAIQQEQYERCQHFRQLQLTFSEKALKYVGVSGY